MRCIQTTGSDDRMDCREMFYDPLNSLPAKCPTCGFPDLEYVPQPYFLVKSRAQTSKEIAPAENGNYLVRERTRRILELVAARQFRFYPTCYKGTTDKTPWFLAVPCNQVATATVKARIRRCTACKEPKSAHPGSQFDKWLWDKNSQFDAVKSSTWGSSDTSWKEWMCRASFLSVRLFHLLKKVKVNGIDEATCGTRTAANDEEASWIKASLQALVKAGIPLLPAGAFSTADAAWFKSYLKSHVAKKPPALDIKAIEKRLKFKLPKSYAKFISIVGTAHFKDVDEEKGLDVQILAPGKFDLTSYRKGKLIDDEESMKIDGVMFAETGHGDCFCFDIQKGRPEFRVFLFKHEYGSLEPYAANFVEFLKRVSGG